MLLFVVFLGAHILQNFNVFLQWIKLMWRFVGLCAIAGQDHFKKSVHSLITWSDWGGGVANCFDSFTEIKVESRRFYKVSQEVLSVVYSWHVLPLFSPEEHATVVLHHEVTTCCVCSIYFRSRNEGWFTYMMQACELGWHKCNHKHPCAWVIPGHAYFFLCLCLHCTHKPAFTSKTK